MFLRGCCSTIRRRHAIVMNLLNGCSALYIFSHMIAAQLLLQCCHRLYRLKDDLSLGHALNMSERHGVENGRAMQRFQIVLKAWMIHDFMLLLLIVVAIVYVMLMKWKFLIVYKGELNHFAFGDGPESDIESLSLLANHCVNFLLSMELLVGLTMNVMIVLLQWLILWRQNPQQRSIGGVVVVWDLHIQNDVSGLTRLSFF
jgi:hypothetical protein